MKKLIIFLLVFVTIQLSAQHKFGVRAGLNYSSYLGDTDPGESYSLNSGFHFGINYTYMFTPELGLRGEILYTQRGSGYKFLTPDSITGTPYLIKSTNSADLAFLDYGLVDLTLELSNGYLSVPLTLQYQASRKFEVFGGITIDMLIQPGGRGKVDYSSILRPDGIFFQQSLDYNYRSNPPGELTFIQEIGAGQEFVSLIVDDMIVTIPRTVSAYYNYQRGEEIEKKYNFFNAHLTLGTNYFINNGFYIGARAEYGLFDLTNNKGDFSMTEFNSDGSYVYKDDFDRSISLNLSFGFRF